MWSCSPSTRSHQALVVPTSGMPCSSVFTPIHTYTSATRCHQRPAELYSYTCYTLYSAIQSPSGSRRWAAAPGAFPRTPRTRAATACPPPSARALHASPAHEERRLRRRLLGELDTLFERGAAREAVGAEWPTAPPCRCRTARRPSAPPLPPPLDPRWLRSPSGRMAQDHLCALSDGKGGKGAQVISRELPGGQGGRGTESR